jgi:hypothetical protein
MEFVNNRDKNSSELKEIKSVPLLLNHVPYRQDNSWRSPLSKSPLDKDPLEKKSSRSRNRLNKDLISVSEENIFNSSKNRL